MDDKAPLKSLNIDFSNKIIIKKGDHDLEQPEIIEQWLNKAVMSASWRIYLSSKDTVSKKDENSCLFLIYLL